MNDRIVVSATDEITRFAPSKLPNVKKGDQRYLFERSHEAIEFIEGIDTMNFLDDNHCMVLRLSIDFMWAVDFEKKYSVADLCENIPGGDPIRLTIRKRDCSYAVDVCKSNLPAVQAETGSNVQ